MVVERKQRPTTKQTSACNLEDWRRVGGKTPNCPKEGEVGQQRCLKNPERTRYTRKTEDAKPATPKMVGTTKKAPGRHKTRGLQTQTGAKQRFPAVGKSTPIMNGSQHCSWPKDLRVTWVLDSSRRHRLPLSRGP